MTARPEAAAAHDEPTSARGPEVVLEEGMHFDGLVVLPTSARIDGRVRGEVLARDRVEVGATGVVMADLEASTVVVEGRVIGAVRARDAVRLGPGAVVEGDLTAPKLTIAEGARVDGRCACGTPRGETASPPEEAASAPAPGPSAS